MWAEFIWLRIGSSGGRGQGNEALDSIKGRKFVGQLSD
jgi:hypothetical protein